MNDDDVDKLIELVKGYPAIYDRNSVRYKNSAYKATVWQNIALTLGQSETEVLTRWRSLRDRFCREHRKMLDQDAITPRFEWAYYKNLMFLKNHTIHRSRFSNTIQDEPSSKISQGNSQSPLRMLEVDVVSIKDDEMYELEEQNGEYDLNEYTNIPDKSSESSRQSSPTHTPLRSPTPVRITSNKKRKIEIDDHNYNDVHNHTPNTSFNVGNEINEIGTEILKTLHTFEKCMKIKKTTDSEPKSSKEQFFDEVRVFINGFSESEQNKAQNRIIKYLCKCKLEILNNGNLDKVQI